ncbi:putative Methyl-CpG-binding domain-containing protein [Helianthus annuus]|uniref:Methyl-CpG-binding domain-containing protein n=1 Tax=Helianthus annuus TaxID=4232 RepID=A0A251SDE7_HELAN|nr:methyl-CpG-binding domain-containing protein 13 isoform X1 [Helianthus annuus]KAF5766772.1 putative Methyl-CpG-binding domain-containing protein [Helianthus annuus]
MSPVKSPEQHSVRDVGKTNKFVVGNDEADELPPGWTKELKTRKSGSRTKVDRRYTDPVTGYIFHSLKDAQRYVKTGEVGSLATKPKNNECVDTDNKDERLHMEEKEERSESKEQHSARDVGKTNKIVAENDEADELPPGWTMELKKRKPGSKTKFDRRYTDPVTGYIFISLKDAQRYVKTGVLGRLARKPKNNEDEKLHIEERSKSKDSETLRRKRPLDNTGTEFSETGKSELIHRASKRLAAPSPPEPKTRQATRLAEVTVDASVSSPSQVEPKTRNATHKGGIKIISPPPSPPDTRIKIDASVTPPPVSKTRQAAHQSGIEIDSPTSLRDSKTRHATPLVGTEVPSPPPQPEPKTQQAKHLYSIVDNASPASLPPAKTRRATRQAGIEINAPPPSLPDTRTGRQATRARLVNLASPKKTDKKTEAEKMTDKHNQENHGNPKEHNNKIEMGPATLPPVYFEKKELPAVNATVSNPMPQSGYGYGGNMKSSDSSINFSMNDLWTDPCIEFAVKTLTGAIPCEDLNKPENPAPSPLKVPLEDLWTDPCIEFAVKTLTGAIPVGENDRLQQRTDTSRNTRAPHDFYLPDVGPAGQNKQQQQQQQGSTYGNVGFQNSGNFANGQCSRYRFF